MSSNSRLPQLLALVGAASAATLSSCTLPADQAWRKIKDDGLLSYWSYEMGSTHSDAPKQTGVPQATAPSAHLAQTSPSPINQPGMMETGKPLVAQSIASLPGFVRSPYTNPPRLVDVKGATPGSTMICPYTQRPFIVPGDFVNAPSGSMVAETKPEPKSAPAPTPSVTSTTTAETTKTETKVESLPKVVINNKPTEPSSTPSSAPTKAKSDTASSSVAGNTTAPTSTAPAAAPKPVQEIPFGAAIAGRPGFVNSPFAAKHQLVDVTGLPAGMEVKCPYTGKLFRVPPQDMASSKPAETAPLSSPEEPQKK